MSNNHMIDISKLIHIFRDQKVILDRDLAKLYNVEVKTLNQSVKRNIDRFPQDFCFQLTTDELKERWSQIVTIYGEKTMGYMLRTPPFVFTEAGSLALSFTIRSSKAIEMGQFIIRAFTHLRRFILKNENLMMELKNNDHLSKTFSNFEKRIEQDLVVLYKNTSKFEKRFKSLEEEIKLFKKSVKV